MAQCEKCGALKLTEQPCSRCGHGSNSSAAAVGAIPVNIPEGLPEIGNLGFEDIEAAFNMRGWLQRACEAAGSKMTGAGMGCGCADIWIELEGHEYMVTIKPCQKQHL